MKYFELGSFTMVKFVSNWGQIQVNLKISNRFFCSSLSKLDLHSQQQDFLFKNMILIRSMMANDSSGCGQGEERLKFCLVWPMKKSWTLRDLWTLVIHKELPVCFKGTSGFDSEISSEHLKKTPKQSLFRIFRMPWKA